MNDETIRMAREVGATTVDADDPQCWIGSLAFTRQELERFYRAAFAAGAAAERERIVSANAPVIESINRHIKTLEEAFDAAIRARGKA